MTQCETRDDIEITLFKLDFFLRGGNKTFPFINVVNPEIWTNDVRIIPFIIQFDIVDMKQGEVVP